MSKAKLTKGRGFPTPPEVRAKALAEYDARPDGETNTAFAKRIGIGFDTLKNWIAKRNAAAASDAAPDANASRRSSPGRSGYTDEKRLAIIAEYDAGQKAVGQIATEHGVHQSTITGWVRKRDSMAKAREAITPEARLRGARRTRQRAALRHSATLASVERQPDLPFDEPDEPAVVANGRVANGHRSPRGVIDTDGHVSPSSVEALKESLRIALRERDAMRVTLDIFQRENEALKRRMGFGGGE